MGVGRVWLDSSEDLESTLFEFESTEELVEGFCRLFSMSLLLLLLFKSFAGSKFRVVELVSLGLMDRLFVITERLTGFRLFMRLASILIRSMRVGWLAILLN